MREKGRGTGGKHLGEGILCVCSVGAPELLNMRCCTSSHGHVQPVVVFSVRVLLFNRAMPVPIPARSCTQATVKFVKSLLGIAAAGDMCVLSTKADDSRCVVFIGIALYACEKGLVVCACTALFCVLLDSCKHACPFSFLLLLAAVVCCAAGSMC